MKEVYKLYIEREVIPENCPIYNSITLRHIVTKHKSAYYGVVCNSH